MIQDAFLIQEGNEQAIIHGLEWPRGNVDGEFEEARRPGRCPSRDAGRDIAVAAPAVRVSSTAPDLRQEHAGRKRDGRLAGVQGNRILSRGKTAEKSFQEVFVPAGLQSFAAETPTGGSVLLEDEQCQLSEERGDFGAVAGADSRAVF